MRVVGIVLLVIVVVVGLRLAVLYSHIITYRTYWQQQASLPVAADTLTYVALGDSAAQGIGASQPQKGYVGLVAAALQQKSGRPVHVINLSVSGAKVSDVLHKQLPELQKLTLPKDAVVTLDIGANDMQAFRAATFTKDMDTLLSQLPVHCAVADIPYFGGGRKRSLEPSALAASAIIDQLATKYNLPLAHLHDATKDQQGLGDFAADFFHPSDTAYKKWFKAFWKQLG